MFFAENLESTENQRVGNFFPFSWSLILYNLVRFKSKIIRAGRYGSSYLVQPSHLTDEETEI